MPPNDVREQVAPIFIADSAGLGLRQNFQNLVTGGPVAGLPLNETGGSRDDTGDPPLVRPNLPAGDEPFSNCTDRDPVVTPFTYAWRTVWYRLVADATGAAFGGRSLVTLDTAGSSTRHVLSVYPAVPPAFDPGANPLLLPDVIACDLGVTGLASQVSFVAEAGKTYAVMVGLPANTTSTLTLSGRVLDVEAPRVRIGLPTIPDVSSSFDYEITASDGAQTALTLQQFTSGGTLRPPLTKVNPADCKQAPLGRGEYCQAGSLLRVRWRPVAGPERGVVAVTYRDAAGNEGTNSHQAGLRDRRPPRFATGYPTVRFTSRRRFVVRVVCYGGPGEVRVYLNNARSPAFRKLRRGTTMAASAGFRRPRGLYFIRTVCADRSDNEVERWSYAQVP
jgi:hypothetical protein